MKTSYNEAMNVLICVKAVNKKMISQFQDLFDNYCINPYDLCALKDIIQLKKKSDVNIKITCLSMGALDSAEVLKKCLAMGADDAYLLSDSTFAGSDTVATTYILAKAIKYLGEFDIIVCGAKSVDGETGQVAYGLAQRLGLTSINNVTTIEKVKDTIPYVKQCVYGKCRTYKILKPTVMIYKDFSLDLGMISLLLLRKAQRQEIKVINSEIIQAKKEMCGFQGSQTSVIGSSSLLCNKHNKVIQGDSKDKATQIYDCIKAIV